MWQKYLKFRQFSEIIFAFQIFKPDQENLNIYISKSVNDILKIPTDLCSGWQRPRRLDAGWEHAVCRAAAWNIHTGIEESCGSESGTYCMWIRIRIHIVSGSVLIKTKNLPKILVPIFCYNFCNIIFYKIYYNYYKRKFNWKHNPTKGWKNFCSLISVFRFSPVVPYDSWRSNLLELY